MTRPADITDRTAACTAGGGEPVLGNYFVAAYPPFSAWSAASNPALHEALDQGQGASPAPLGIYVHVPFCQKKCDYCYYLSYIAQPAAVVNRYLDAVLMEGALYANQPAVDGRPPAFVYFGGGTPSMLGQTQVRHLIGGLRETFRWDRIREVTFECAPRSVSSELLAVLRGEGVTRLSMGVQSFDDDLLATNGRMHLAADVHRAFRRIRDAGCGHVNLDLMCGLLGETEAQWRETIRQAVELRPESVTIYQTEVPRNTLLCRDFEAGTLRAPMASWETKRARLAEGFDALENAGYTVISGYNAVLDPERHRFLYQEDLWRGADLLGLGVASFGYFGGVHYQNATVIEDYEKAVAGGDLPLGRAFKLAAEDRLVREFILQLKLGVVQLAPLRARFGVDPLEVFAAPLRALAADGLLECSAKSVQLTRAGLLRIDRLLPRFYAPGYQSIRYT
jgi:oxygen-independent coproporphyrinogen-3 oxidase